MLFIKLLAIPLLHDCGHALLTRMHIPALSPVVDVVISRRHLGHHESSLRAGGSSSFVFQHLVSKVGYKPFTLLKFQDFKIHLRFQNKELVPELGMGGPWNITPPRPPVSEVMQYSAITML